MKKTIKVVTFILIVIALVVAAKIFIGKRKVQEAKTPQAKEYAVIIDTMSVAKKVVKLTLPAIALSKSDNVAVVASKVSGRVLYSKKSGDIVQKGDILVKIDDTSLKASLESIKRTISSVKAALANLELVHKRTAKLLKVGGATKEQYDAESVKIDGQKAQITSLHSKAATVEDNLSYSIIKADADAIISQSMVTVGDLAMPGKPLMKLSQKAKSYLLVRVPNTIKAVEYDSKEYKASSLDSTFNGLNEYRVNVDKHISAGQRVDVDIVTFKGKGIVLPVDATVNRDGKNYVMVINGNKTLPKEVKIIASGQEGIVVSGLKSGEKIAVAKPDILLRLVSGYPFVVKNSK
jgi:RND family efflux transporter MFP subunit